MDNNTDKVFSKNLFSNFSSSISFDKRIYKEDIVSNNFDTSASHLIEYVIEEDD